ncbi:MAG: hypothetical protein V3W14_03070 [Candidatus Neomarinimicrobiota bacterium]
MSAGEIDLNLLVRHKYHALRKLIQKVVHDTNNYFGVFQGYISLLEMTMEDKQVLEKYLPPMKDALQSGIGLNTLLAKYYRVAPPMLIQVDLTALAKEVCRQYAAEHNFTVTVVAEESLPTVPLEEPDVRRILMDLCQLAEVTGTVSAHMQLEAQQLEAPQLAGLVLESSPGEYIRLRLTVAIDKFEQEEVTEFLNPFALSKNVKADLGLGLLVPLLRNHGGTLDLSLADERLTLALHFPVKPRD